MGDELNDISYRELATFTAVVYYPYDVALTLFYELYAMGVPMFLPRVDLLPFYTFRGLHSSRDYHHVRSGRDPGDGPSPFFGALNYNQWFQAALYWSSWTDFARFPHVFRFGHVGEVLTALESGVTDWMGTSISRRRVNAEKLVIPPSQWARAATMALHLQL